MPYAKLIPFEEVVPAWPADLFSSPPPGSLGIVGYEVVERGTSLTASLDIALASDLTVSIAGLDGFELVLPGDPDNPLRAEATLSGTFAASVEGFDATLRVRSALLIPVQLTGTPPVWEPVVDDLGQPVPLELAMNVGSLVIDEAFQPRFELDQSASLNHPFMIGATGLVIEATNVRPVLSANEPPPAGLAAGFRGISIEAAAIHLPDSFALDGITPESIALTGLAIGNGGVSGGLSGSWLPVWTGNVPSGPGAGTLLGLPFALRSLGIAFLQNAVIGAQLSGDLVIPFFDERVAVTVQIDLDGSFLVEIAAPDPRVPGPIRIQKPGIGSLELTALAIRRDAEGTALFLSGRLTLEVGSPALQWPTIEVQDLRIGPDGKVQIPGGWIDLQQPLALDLYGFGLEISRVGFGNEEDGRRWIGVDGALRLTELLPAGASARGLRVTWDPAAASPAPALSLDGIGVTFGVPDAFAFEGQVALTEDAASGARLFTGGLGLGLDALDIGIDAGITVGRLADDTFVFVTLGVNVPIPIAATGAALYGLQGLFAMNMSPVVTNSGWPANATPPTVAKGDWYGWYKLVPPAFTVDEAVKWSPDPGAWAFGAGLTIGTLPDAGFSVNTKALLVVLLPGPVILLEGKADIFKVPPQLSGATEGTLSLLAALDGRAGTLQLGIDAAWSLVKVIEIAASTDAFFDFDRPDAWHLWLGQKTPESARIRAEYLALWHADAWMMLDASGVNTGLGVGFGDAWKFGPVRVVLEAWIGGEASLSARPPQLAGQLAIGGEAAVSAGPFGTGIRVEAALSGKSFAPYEVKGTFSVVVDLPKPFKDLDVEIELEWSEPATPVIADPWVSALVEHARCTESWTPAASSIGAAEDDDAPVVPLDAGILLAFAKPMGDSTDVADNAATSAPVVLIGDYRATYSLQSVRLFRKRRSHPGENWTEVTDTLFGTWTPDADGAGSRLQLLARSPFAFTRFTSRRWSDAFVSAHGEWPCSPRPEPETTCTHWRDVPLDTRMPAVWTQDGVTFASEADLTVLPASSGPRVLRLGAGAGNPSDRRAMWLALPTRASTVRLDVVKGQPGPLVLVAWSEGRIVATDTQAGMGEFEMRVAAPAIDALTLDWTFEQEAGLDRLCWTSKASTDARAVWQSNRDRLEASAERWSSDEPVLEPECFYRLEVETLALLEKGGDDIQREERTHAIQFQTGGPPAIVPEWVAPAETPEGQPAALFPFAGVLKDLAPYVRHTIPDDAASPVFRAYDLGCEFDATHVQQMYGADMRIRLRDDNGQPAIDAQGLEIVFANQWEEAPTVTLSQSDAAWLARLNACTEAVDWQGLRGNDSMRTAVGGLLVDDFSGDAATNWSAFVLDPAETRQAAWQLDAGVLRQTVDIAGGNRTPASPDKPGTVYIARDVAAADVAVETTMSTRSGTCGVVFRWIGQRDFFRFSLGPGGAQLVHVAGGLARALWSGAEPYSAGASACLAVQADGARIRCQIDERLVCDVVVGDRGGVGAVGLYCWDTKTVNFDEIRARDWPGSALAAARAYDAELEASRPLFTDAFESLEAFDCQVLSTERAVSTCAAAGGIATIAKPANWSTVGALAGAETMADYSVECNARPMGAGVFGLVARHGGPRDYLSLELGPNGRALVSHEAAGADLGQIRNLWSDDVPAEESREYALAVRCEGATVTVVIDGETVASRDTGHVAGRFGLLSAIDTPNGCEFRDLVVRSSPRTAVHRWRFTTSRYLGLPDLADSFGGQVWPIAAAIADRAVFAAAAASAATTLDVAAAVVDTARAGLASAVATGSVLDVPVLTATALAAVEARQAASVAAHDSLVDLLGLDYRPVPPIVELSRADAEGEALALLLDLPEPLPWGRVAWTLSASLADDRSPSSESVVAWSGDGARAVFVKRDGTPFEPGSWTLGLALHLDVGVERAVWRRAGSSAPEVARLSFVVS